MNRPGRVAALKRGIGRPFVQAANFARIEMRRAVVGTFTDHDSTLIDEYLRHAGAGRALLPGSR